MSPRDRTSRFAVAMGNRALRWAGALLCVGLMVSVARADDPAAAESRRVALVIGNAAYEHVSELVNPFNDATDVAEKLRTLSFDVILATNLTRDEMREAFQKFSDEIKPGDVALFFYAGHGIAYSGENFLIPVDMPSEIQVENESVINSALNNRLVNMADALKPMQSAKLGLIFLDACRNTPSKEELGLQIMTPDGQSPKLRAISFERGLTKLTAASTSGATGIFRAYATQPNNVSDDGTGRNSPFTKALLRHLGTPGLDIHEMMRKIRLEVRTETNGRQVPWEESALTEAYEFAPRVAAREPISLEPPPGAPPGRINKSGKGKSNKADRPSKRSKKASGSAKSSGKRRNKSASKRARPKPRVAARRRAARRSRLPPGLGAGVGAGF